MANIKELIQSIESGDSSFDEKLAAINKMEETLVAMREQEKEAVDDNVELIVEAIKLMEKKVADQLEIAQSIVPEKGDKGDKGQDGLQGRDGLNGKDGRDGKNGLDGKDGEDGVSVTDAKIDFDGSLVITLSTGREINVGEVVAPDLAERLSVISTMSTNTAVANITSGTIDGTVIGGTTPAAGTFTTLNSTSTATLGGDATNPSLVAAAVSAPTRWLQISGSAVSNVTLAVQGTGTPNLILQNRSSGSINFATNNSASNVQLVASHTASAVNYVQVTGAATGSRPQISAQGSDGNIGLSLYSKGNRSITLYTNNVQVLDALSPTSSVNSWSIAGSITGIAPTLAVGGSDTNISQVFQSKGTGAIDLAAGSSGVNISNGGTVTAITRTAAGTGYTSVPTVNITAPTTAGGVQAVITIPSIVLASPSLSAGGTGYTVNDVLTLVGGTFTIAATLTVTAVSGGVITAVSITNNGVYTVAPSIPASVTGGTGTGATFNASFGINSNFSIGTAGSGYVEQPTVSFSGGGGSGAAAFATIGSATSLKSLNDMAVNLPSGPVLSMTDSSIASGAGAYLNLSNGSSSNAIQRAAGTATNIGIFWLSKGTSGHSFGTNNSTSTIQFVASHTASAVNYVQVTGNSTTNAPILSSQGSDTNIGFRTYSKGTGSISFWTAGGSSRQFQVSHATGTVVNYATATGSIAGASPVFGVEGTDTDIDLTLTPKGAGNVRFGTYTASALLAVAGYITIKDSGGTTRRLLVG